MATPGRKPGRPNSPLGVKWYFKPSMGRVIGRMPGVVRRSASVLAVNKALEDKRDKPDHPARECKGRTWRDFVKCLKGKMETLMRATEEARKHWAEEIASKYRIPVSTKR